MSSLRTYSKEASRRLLQCGWSFSDLGPGLRASGRLPQDVFREVLGQIEACPGVDPDVKKRGVNSWVGTLMIDNDYKYRVFTGSESMFVPFQGRILRKPAPGGWDHACRQDVARWSSHRPVWAYILDRELT